ASAPGPPAAQGPAYRGARSPQDQPIRVDQPMASCLLLRREAEKEVGPFDEQFPLFFNDVDFCYRLWEAGLEIWYEPRVPVVHHGGRSTRQLRAQAVRASHEGLRRFYRKHYRRRMNPLSYTAAIGLITVSGWVRWAAARWKSRSRHG